MRKYGFALLLCLFCVVVSVKPVAAQSGNSNEAQLKERVKSLLTAYSKKDVPKVMQFLDDKNVLMMGADASEVAATKADIEKLLNNDFRLWETSEFGEFKNFYANFSGKAATAFFDVPWEAKAGGQSRKFLIRFATTWRKIGGEWRLAQIMNAVPTIGQSAEEIMKNNETKNNL